MTSKPKREGRLKVPLPFDEAVRRSLSVKPPKAGWKEYERAKARANRRDRKPETGEESDDADADG